MSYMSEIIKRFDITTIQETKDDISGIEKLQKALGKNFRFLFSDPSCNTERLVFCYNKRMMLCRSIRSGRHRDRATRPVQS